MKKRITSWLSVLLVFSLLISMLSMTALAYSTNDDGTVNICVQLYTDDYTESTDGYTSLANWRNYANAVYSEEMGSVGELELVLTPEADGSVFIECKTTEIPAKDGTGSWVVSSLTDEDGTFTVEYNSTLGGFSVTSDQLDKMGSAATVWRDENGAKVKGYALNFVYSWKASESTSVNTVTYSCENATEGPTVYARMAEQWAEDCGSQATQSGYVSYYVPTWSANAVTGQTYTVKNWGDGFELTNGYGLVQIFDGRSAFFMTHSNGTGSGVVWIYQGYKYSTDGGTTWSGLVSVYDTTTKDDGTTAYTLKETTIDVPEDTTGVKIAYQFTAAATTNFIYELRNDRVVYQNQQAKATVEKEDTTAGTWDTYTVTSTEGITVKYTPTMSMENLGSDVFDYLSWDVLQKYEASITDDTRVYLHFFFDTDYIDLTNSDFSKAYLESDMFDLVDEESTGETAITVNAETGEVLVTCQWDSESADAIYAANGALNPMIYFKGFTLAVTDKWGTDTDGKDVTSIKIFNDGYVDGTVVFDKTGPVDAGKYAIWGGYEDDTFILQLAGKTSEPGLNKTIVVTEADEDGEETTTYKDQDDVAAGDTVDFELTSTVPDTLEGYIDYTGVEKDAEIIPLGTVGTDKDGNTYTYDLTFHDVMDEKLAFQNDITVTLVDSEGNKTVLTNTEDETYYTVTTSTTDGCTFEVSMDLLALYTAGIITEADFGFTSIVVSYSAKLNTAATAGTYKNTAWVSYLDENSEKDTVEVDTYGLSIFKYDQETAEYAEDGTLTSATGLSDAEFTVYSDSTLKTEVTTLTTDADGNAATTAGLDAGTYYLVETKTPTGYVSSGAVITVTVGADSNSTTNNVAYLYVANAPIPSTGGAGTAMYTAVGAAILVVAGCVFLVTRRKRETDAE